MTSKASRNGSHLSKTLETVLEELPASRPEVADEIQALQAIFGEGKLTLYESNSSQDNNSDSL